MREVMLITHFIGLAMGIGTSFGFMFLGIAGSKMEKEERQKFALNTFALSKMGYIGITLLVLSGGYLMTPYWSSLAAMPLLIAKLALVVVLITLLGIARLTANKAKKGDPEIHLKKLPIIGRITVLIGLAIVVLAVSVFL